MGVSAARLAPLASLASLLLVAGGARAEKGEIAVDVAAGAIEVKGAGAPDLRAPSVQVGRVQGERAARGDAARRLVRGLTALPPARLGCLDPAKLPSLEKAIAEARPTKIEYGSDGSVKLVLRLTAAQLAPPAAGGARVVLLDGAVQPSLFTGSGSGSCAAARATPPVFDTVKLALAAAGVAGAQVVTPDKLTPDAQVVAIARSDR